MSQSYVQPEAPFKDFKYVQDKKLVFVTCIWPDGMGDLGHLVDLSNPSLLRHISEKIGVTITPYYVIGHVDDAKIKKQILQSLYECGIYQLNDKQKLFGPVSLSTYPADQFANTGLVRWKPIYPMQDCGVITISARTSEYQTGLIWGTSCIANIWEHGPAHKIKGDLITECKRLGDNPNKYMRTLEYSSLGDYGNDFRIILHPQTTHSLADKAKCLVALQNKRLVFDLIGEIDEQKPDLDLVEKFLKENLFVPAYVKDSYTLKKYIEALCTSPEVQKYQNLCLYSNKTTSFASDEIEKLGLSGFATVILHQGKSSPEITKIDNPTGNKTLHLYSGYDLTDPDYRSLFAIAQKYAVCSGDKTLENCLSNQLVFISKTPLTFKNGFYNSLTETLSQYTQNPNVLEYLKLLNASRIDDINVEIMKKMMTLAATKSFDKDWQNMCQQFYTKHNFLDIYPDFIRKNLMIHEVLSAIQENDLTHAEKVLAGFNRAELQNLWKLTKMGNNIPKGASEIIKNTLDKRAEEPSPTLHSDDTNESKQNLKK